MSKACCTEFIPSESRFYGQGRIFKNLLKEAKTVRVIIGGIARQHHEMATLHLKAKRERNIENIGERNTRNKLNTKVCHTLFH